MARKPWVIIVLTAVLILLPIYNIITTYVISKHNVTFTHYLYSLFALKENYVALFNLIVPSLITAYAVYSVKKWSYIVLGLCVFWISGLAIYDVVKYYGSLNTLQIIFAVVLPILFSFAITIYFLVPAVKTTYFDPKIRWWEAKPRYIIEIGATVEQEEGQHSGKITNISEGGCFVQLDDKLLELDSMINVKFKFDEKQYVYEAQIVFNRTDIKGYGVQFQNLSREKIREARTLIKNIKLSGASLSRPLPMWNDDLKKWFLNLIKTGKGLTPELPGKYKVK
jgi:hypothetical protein